jgi:hypothetical protein
MQGSEVAGWGGVGRWGLGAGGGGGAPNTKPRTGGRATPPTADAAAVLPPFLFRACRGEDAAMAARPKSASLITVRSLDSSRFSVHGERGEGLVGTRT